jgi:antitoxin MazE
MMKTRIVRIGNSRGVRIPKPLLEQSGLGDEVELEVEAGRITIRAVREVRRTWPDAFRTMAESGDDALLDTEEAPGADWDEKEWEW